jgi:hypothetical protein
MIVSKSRSSHDHPRVSSQKLYSVCTKSCITDQSKVGSHLTSCFPGSSLTEFNSINGHVVYPDGVSEPDRILRLPFQNVP